MKIIVIPLVLFTLVTGSSSISPKKLGKIGGKIIGWYFAVALIAAGISVGLAINPGVGFQLEGIQQVPESVVSIFENILSGMVLPIIIFALAFGIILAYLRSSKQMHHREKGERLFNFFNAGAEFMYKVVRFVLEVAPYGVFALIAIAISQQGISIFIPFGKIIGTAALGTGILIAGIYSLLLFAFKLNPLKFFKGAKEAMLTAFVTRSSCGTLPVTMKCADEGLGIDKRIYTFSLPIGATINMHGTTIYLLSVAVFAANAIPYLLTFPEILILMVVAVVISVGVAGIPAGGLIMLTITLSTVFPPAVVGPVVGLIAGIDIILDMIRIMGNVTGDLVCTAMVAKTEGLLDFSKGVWKESNIA